MKHWDHSMVKINAVVNRLKLNQPCPVLWVPKYWIYTKVSVMHTHTCNFDVCDGIISTRTKTFIVTITLVLYRISSKCRQKCIHNMYTVNLHTIANLTVHKVCIPISLLSAKSEKNCESKMKCRNGLKYKADKIRMKSME